MYFKRLAAVLMAGVGLFCAGCGKTGNVEQAGKQAGPIRVAILPVDDQRGEAAEAWPAAVLPVAIARQFANQQQLTVRTADSAPDALHAGATHLVHARLGGNVSNVELLLEVETVAERKIKPLGAVRAGGGKWLQAAVQAANKIKSAIAPGAGALAAPGVNGEQALALLGQALAGRPDAPGDLDAVEKAHPDCGWCWEAASERLLRKGDREGALALLRRSRSAQGVDEISRARLELLESGLSGDQAMRAQALERLSRLTPGNIEVLSELASRATREKRWEDAVHAWKRVLAADPANPNALNQLGYVEAWQGRFDEGLKWLNLYEAGNPGSANAADSKGEVLVMAGRFSEAEQSFVWSYEKDPDFNAGAAMEKAALACWLRGDENAARTRLDAYLKDRSARGDPLVEWRRARWLYLTGKTEQARRLLDSVLRGGAPPAQAFAQASLALWSFEAGDGVAAALHLAGLARIQHPAAARLLPLAASIANPGAMQKPPEKFNEGITALMRGEPGKAIEALKAAVRTSEPGEEWLARELLAWAYVLQGDPAAAGELTIHGWPIPATLEGQVTDFLVYPNLFYVRAKVALHKGDSAAAGKLFELYLKSAGTRPGVGPRIEEARRAVRL